MRMSEKSISVAIIEDTKHLADLLSALINGTNGFELKSIYDNAETAIADLHNAKPDVCIVDIHLPGLSGIELIRQLKPQMSDCQFMIFTVFEDPDILFDALSAGATGYLIKSTPPVKIIESIYEIASGGSPMSGNIARTIINKFQPQKNIFIDKLTERERETLQLMAKGFRYKEIADKMFVSIETVRSHIRHIYEKLEVQSKTEAINKAFPR